MPIYNRQDLIDNLKPLITAKPSEKIPCATGIPPHIEINKKMRNVLGKLNSILLGMENQQNVIEAAIEKGFEKNCIQSGHISRQV